MTDDRGRPYSKRLARQIERALSDERTVDWIGDAAQRDEVRTGSDQASGTTKRRRPVSGLAGQRAGWMIAAR